MKTNKSMNNFISRSFVSANLFILILTGIAFFLLNRFTWLYCDDFPYAFCITDHGLDLTRPISGFCDAVVSQYYHFLHSHGRVLAIGLDQWFIGMRNKLPFDICNTLVFIGYIWLLQKLSNRRSWGYTLLIFSMQIVLFRAYGQVFLWMTGCMNYLWAGFFNLAFLLVLRKNLDNNSLRRGAFPILLALIAGWWQESFSVGILAAMGLFIIYRLWQRQPYAKVPTLMAVAYLIGFLIILASPGNMARLRDERVFDGGFLHIFLRNTHYIVLGMRICWIFLFTVIIQKIRHKLQWKQFAHDNSFIFWAITFEILFLLILGPGAEPRAFFGVETLAMILLLRLLPIKMPMKMGVAMIVICLSAYLPLLRLTYNNHQVTQAFLKELTPTDGTVFFDLPQYNHTDRHYLGSLVVSDHRSKIFYTEAAYYGKPRLMVLPKRLQQELYFTSSFICPEHLTANGEYTIPEFKFTIKPLPRNLPLPQPSRNHEYVSFPSGNYQIKNKPHIHDELWKAKR